MSQNPFYVSGPVPLECFVGRSVEIKIAFDQISKHAHAAFYGSPGMGKSSLLRQLIAPTVWNARGLDMSQFWVVSFNCTDVNPFTSTKFYRAILEHLQEQVEESSELEEAIAAVLQEDLIEKSDLRRIVGRIGQQGKSLLLLLDDFDWVLHPHAAYTEIEMLTFLNEFRNLAVHSAESQYLSTIVTSFRPITELGPTLIPGGSPWYNHFLCHVLRPFSEQEVEKYFFTVDSPLFIPISPQLKTAILQLTDGHPALLQNAFYLLYDKLQAGQIPNGREFAQDFKSRTSHFFRDTWQFSTNEDQVLLMLIALYQREGRLNRQSQFSLNDLDLVFSQRGRELFELE